MAKSSKGFCMFYDWVDDLDLLEGDDAWKVVKAIRDYYVDGREPVEHVEKHLKPVVSMIRNQIRRAEEKAAAGKKGAAVTNGKRKGAGADRREIAADEWEEIIKKATNRDSGEMGNADNDDNAAIVPSADCRDTAATETETKTYTETETDTYTDTLSSSPLPPSAEGESDAGGFGLFWKLYPVKRERKEAEKAFREEIKTQRDLHELMAMESFWLDSWEWTKMSRDKIKLPADFIRQTFRQRTIPRHLELERKSWEELFEAVRPALEEG